MKKIKIWFFTLLTVFVLNTSSFAEVVEFNANTFFNAEHPLAKYGKVEWAEIVKNKSNGELVPKVFTGSALLEPRAGMSGIRDGIAQVGYHAGSYTPNELPESAALQELGFSYSDPLVLASAIADFAFNDKRMAAQWKKNGIVYGGSYATPGYIIFCRSKVTNLENIKGKKIRTSGAAVSTWVESVGAVPVNVPSSEMYSGLDKGTLDCATNAPNDLKSRKLWEVSTHTTNLPLGMYWSGFEWGYNPDFWKSLSKKHKAVLFDSTALAMAKLYIGYKAAATEALEEAPSHGTTVHQPDAALTANVAQFTKDNMSNIYKIAKDKYKLNNPESLIKDFQEVVKKWEKIYSKVDRTSEEAIYKTLNSELFSKINLDKHGL